MSALTDTQLAREQNMSTRHTPAGGLGSMGFSVLRCGLVTTFLWIGALKFTNYEVGNAEPLVTASPLTSRLRKKPVRAPPAGLQVSSVTMSAADGGCLASATPCPAHIDSAFRDPCRPPQRQSLPCHSYDAGIDWADRRSQP